MRNRKEWEDSLLFYPPEFHVPPVKLVTKYRLLSLVFCEMKGTI